MAAAGRRRPRRSGYWFVQARRAARTEHGTPSFRGPQWSAIPDEPTTRRWRRNAVTYLTSVTAGVAPPRRASRVKLHGVDLHRVDGAAWPRTLERQGRYGTPERARRGAEGGGCAHAT